MLSLSSSYSASWPVVSSGLGWAFECSPSGGHVLPADLSPVAGNVDDDKEIDEIYTLLTENYVEDDDAWHCLLLARIRRSSSRLWQAL